MAGIIGIYGLVVSVLISDNLQQELPLFTSFIQLGAGLSVGLAGLAAGFAIGIVGDAGVRGSAQQPRLFVGMVRSIRPARTPFSDLSRFSFSFSPKSWVCTA
jgi:V-type H+-transporting ATPase 16kDa proteolipid subunit